MRIKFRENIGKEKQGRVIDNMIYSCQFDNCKNKNRKLAFHITNTLRPFCDVYETYNYLKKYKIKDSDINYSYKIEKGVPIQVNAFEFLKESICPDNFLYYRKDSKKKRRIYWGEIKYVIYLITLKVISNGGSITLTDRYFGLKKKKDGSRSNFIKDYKEKNKRPFDKHKKSFLNKVFKIYGIFKIVENDNSSLRYFLGDNNPYYIFEKVGE